MALNEKSVYSSAGLHLLDSVNLNLNL